MKTWCIAITVGIVCLIVGYLCGSAALIKVLYATDAKKAEGYYRALGAVQSDEKFLSEFRRVFPGAIERVRYFAPDGEPGFDVVVHLYQRYELTMQLPVSFDVSGTRVVGFGNPSFYLTEVKSVEQTASGTLAVSYDPSGALRFGPKEWEKLVEHGGNFAAIGYQMVVDRPIANFEALTISK